MTVRRLLEELDSRELTEWQAYFRADAQHQEAALEDRRAEARITGE